MFVSCSSFWSSCVVVVIMWYLDGGRCGFLSSVICEHLGSLVIPGEIVDWLESKILLIINLISGWGIGSSEWSILTLDLMIIVGQALDEIIPDEGGSSGGELYSV